MGCYFNSRSPEESDNDFSTFILSLYDFNSRSPEESDMKIIEVKL